MLLYRDNILPGVSTSTVRGFWIDLFLTEMFDSLCVRGVKGVMVLLTVVLGDFVSMYIHNAIKSNNRKYPDNPDNPDSSLLYYDPLFFNAVIIIKDWLEKCDKLRKLEFNPQREVSSKLRGVGPYRPSTKETLKKEQRELYNLLVKYDITQKV